MNNFIIFIFLLISLILLFLLYPIVKVCCLLFFDKNEIKEVEIDLENN